MHFFMFLKKIVLFILIVYINISCASNKNTIESDTDLSFSAKGTNEGIFIHFYNIPKNAMHLSVIFEDITGGNQIIHEIRFWDNEYYTFNTPQNELEELRRNPILLFPFSKIGHEYAIEVKIFTDKNRIKSTNYTNKILSIGGIYLINNPFLYFSDGYNNLILSEKPIFSEEIKFSQYHLFNYNVKIILDEGNWCNRSNYWNELTFPSHELYSDGLEHFNWFSGQLSVFGFIQVILIYENMEWLIGIARTEEIIIMKN